MINKEPIKEITPDQQKIGTIASSKLSAKGRRLARDKITINIFCKGIRRLIRIDPKTNLKRQEFLVAREYRNLLKDISSLEAGE